MYNYCLPAAFSLQGPGPAPGGPQFDASAAETSDDSLSDARTVSPAIHYPTEVVIASGTAGAGLFMAVFPATFLTIVPPQGGCGCPPPPRDHACSCWAIAMFPIGTAVGATTGILFTEALLLPDEPRPVIPPFLGSLGAAGLIALAGPAFLDGKISPEVYLPTLIVGTALSGTITNALYKRR